MEKIIIPTTLPTLQSQVLTLRPMADGDAASLFEIYGDPLVMKYTDEPPFPDLATVGIMLKSVRALLLDGRSLEWAIVSRGDGVVGTCGLHSFDTVLGVAEVGCLLKRGAWGRGLMAEALALLTGFAADVLKLKRLIADVAPENRRARRLFDKLGYRQERPGILAIDLYADPGRAVAPGHAPSEHS